MMQSVNYERKINFDRPSSWEKILSDVPQGSFLDLLILNIFISNIFLFIKNIHSLY